MRRLLYVFIALLLQSCAGMHSDKATEKLDSNKKLQFEIVAEGITKVDNLYLSDAGILFATLERSKHRGELIRIENGKIKILLTQLNSPDGLAGKGRYLFVTEEVREGRIIRYDLQTNTSKVITTQIQKPEGIDILIDGDLLITEDKYKGRLIRLSETGSIEVLLDDLPRPEGLCVNSSGKVFVALTATGEIMTYDRGHREILYKGLNEPDQIECAEDGSIWITEDRSPGRLLRLHKGVLDVIMSGLSFPQGIALHKNGSIYIAEQGKDRIIKLSWH